MNCTYKKINWPTLYNHYECDVELELTDVLCSEQELIIQLTTCNIIKDLHNIIVNYLKQKIYKKIKSEIIPFTHFFIFVSDIYFFTFYRNCKVILEFVPKNPLYYNNIHSFNSFFVKYYSKEKLLNEVKKTITNEIELINVIHAINIFELRKNEILIYF